MTKAKGGSNAGANRITLCTSCNDKHEQRYGARCSIGRPKKLLPDECKKALRRLDGGESRAAVARAMASASLRLVAWCNPRAFPAASS